MAEKTNICFTKFLKSIHLDQQCPTEFLCLPQLCRINKAIRHIFNDLEKEHLQCSDQYDKFYILGHHFSHCFDIFKCELDVKSFIFSIV